MIKYKPKIEKLDEFRIFVENSKKKETKDIKDILSWRKKLKKKSRIKTKLINLSECDNWQLDKKNNLHHKSGQFFKVKGVKTSGSKNREVVSWTQPILTQKHGGVLAFISRVRKDNIVEFLIDAKTEAGDDSDIKLCPTFQATQSNMNRAHGGKRPRFYDIIIKLKGARLIYAARHNEEGARFWKKSNINVIVQIKDPNDKRIKGENYKWVTYSQIKKLSLKNNLVNPFVKTILFMI
jgi:oxidase EvaA